MSKTIPEQPDTEPDDIRAEYDFRGGERGKHYRAFREGYTVRIHEPDGTITVKDYKFDDSAVMLDPDVKEYFRDSEAVNSALRGLIALIPKKPRVTKKRAASK